jgi:hypothetical protein
MQFIAKILIMKNLQYFFSLLLFIFLFSCATQQVKRKTVLDVEGIRKKVEDVDKELTSDLDLSRKKTISQQNEQKLEQQPKEELRQEDVKVKKLAETQEVEFESEGEATGTKYDRLIDIENRAEQDALSKVVKKAGVNVYTGLHNILAYSDKAISQFIGKYTAVWTTALVSYEHVGQPQWVQTGEINKCKIKIKGKIYFKGEPDPNFQLKVENFAPVYYEGDKVNLRISVSKDAYITILCCDEDGNVSVLFPNNYSSNNFLKSNEQLLIPQDVGFELVTFLPEGRNETVELLHIIATKNQPLILPDEIKKKEIKDKFFTYPLGNLKELTTKLAKFNRSDWTQEVLVYKIVKKKQ